MIKHLTYPFCIILIAGSLSLTAQSNIKYGENYFVFEAEDTESIINGWTVRTPSNPRSNSEQDLAAANGSIHQTYLEYTGPWNAGLQSGSDVQLSYTFTCPKTGEYRMLMRMYQPLSPEEAGDKRNDIYTRIEGNFTSATTQPLSQLKTNHKFWGRGVRTWGSCHKLEVGGTHHDARYGFIAGEEYTLYISGRSNGCSLDYILFYEDTPRKAIVIHDDLADPDVFEAAYQPKPAVSVTMDSEDILLSVGRSEALSANVTPSDANDRSLTWTSSNEEVATVSSSGEITAHAEGIVTIKAMSAGRPSASDEVELIVSPLLNWSVTPLSGASNVRTTGALVEAANFGGGTVPSGLSTTLNGVTFEGKVNGNNTNFWENPTTAHFSANSKRVVPSTNDIYNAAIGLQVFDVLLSDFLWDNSEPTVVTLDGLNVGSQYLLQLFMGDTRQSQSGSFILINDRFGSAATTGFTVSNGISMEGTFTANSDKMTFTFSKVVGTEKRGINLNGYQLRNLGPQATANGSRTSSLATQSLTDATETVSDVTPADQLSIYPIPATERIQFNIGKQMLGSNVLMYNQSGQLVINEPVTDLNPAYNVSDWPAGIYMVMIKNNSATIQTKFIVR
ncbi:MAG: Ig-like domain-containing protein [Bacteroidota bacterium]